MKTSVAPASAFLLVHEADFLTVFEVRDQSRSLLVRLPLRLPRAIPIIGRVLEVLLRSSGVRKLLIAARPETSASDRELLEQVLGLLHAEYGFKLTRVHRAKIATPHLPPL